MNSGRLSTPCAYTLAAPDDPALPAAARPGCAAPDAPVGNGWLLDRLGRGFTLVALNAAPPSIPDLDAVAVPAEGRLAERYLNGAPRALYLVRPDQHVAARWRSASPEAVVLERDRALGRTHG